MTKTWLQICDLTTYKRQTNNVVQGTLYLGELVISAKCLAVAGCEDEVQWRTLRKAYMIIMRGVIENGPMMIKKTYLLLNINIMFIKHTYLI